MAYDVGGRGDQSFNDAAAAGLDKAKAELGADVKEASAVNGESESARKERLQQLIDAGYNNIIAVGFAYAKAVGETAKANPDVKFAIVDDASPDSAGPNVDQITFAEEQGSFLVGAAAALKTKTNHVGFVGGVQTDLIKKFETGFRPAPRRSTRTSRSTSSTSRSRRTSPASTPGPRARPPLRACTRAAPTSSTTRLAAPAAASSPRPRRPARWPSASTPTRPRRPLPTSATSSSPR